MPDRTPRSGWSWVGTGEVEHNPHRVRDVSLTDTAATPAWEAGRFRGGWVGWLGYEDAAARAGAPVSADDAEVPPEQWLRVDRFVAFDHAHRRAWAVAPADEVVAFAERRRRGRRPSRFPVDPAAHGGRAAGTSPARTPR